MADMLKLRKAIKDRKPEFKRQDTTHRPNLGTTGWRKPKGLHSKMRHKMAGHRAVPTVGWGSPAAVEGCHPSGLWPVQVNSINDISLIDAKTHGAMIAAGVGKRSKIQLIDALLKKNITILNVKDAKGYASKVQAEIKAHKEERANAAKKGDKPALKKSEPKKPQPQKEMSPEDRKEAERKEAEKVMIQKER
jgi:large subunit ribosomal protein L32e